MPCGGAPAGFANLRKGTPAEPTAVLPLNINITKISAIMFIKFFNKFIKIDGAAFYFKKRKRDQVLNLDIYSIVLSDKSKSQKVRPDPETEIDYMVYKLYNLTKEEIKIIEGGG